MLIIASLSSVSSVPAGALFSFLGAEKGDLTCRAEMMTRMLRNSSMGIPGRLLEYYHTDHCINVLTGREHTPPVDISTLVSLNYSTCYSRA